MGPCFDGYLFLAGVRVSAINVAEGQKQSQILASEGRKLEQINIATGTTLQFENVNNKNRRALCT